MKSMRRAEDLLDDAYDNAMDAFEDAGGKTNEDKARGRNR